MPFQRAAKTKGNPASRRMSNAARAAKRERSWSRGQDRKAQRVKDQKRREAANRLLHAKGELTPWETAKLARRTRRAALQGKGGVRGGERTTPTPQDVQVLHAGVQVLPASADGDASASG